MTLKRVTMFIMLCTLFLCAGNGFAETVTIRTSATVRNVAEADAQGRVTAGATPVEIVVVDGVLEIRY